MLNFRLFYGTISKKAKGVLLMIKKVIILKKEPCSVLEKKIYGKCINNRKPAQRCLLEARAYGQLLNAKIKIPRGMVRNDKEIS